MVTDEQLINRLRTSMDAATADVFPPRGLLDGISPARPRRLRAPSFGGFIVAFATASTIAIVVVAIILLGRAGPPANHAVEPATPPPAAVSTLPSLRAELAVLRRPQIAADKLPAWALSAEEQPQCSNCLNLANVLRRQTRGVTTTHGPDAERFYLILGTVTKTWGNGRISGWRQGASAIQGLHLSLVGVSVRHSATSHTVDELLNPVALAMPADALTPRDVLITGVETVGVVPDGVTKVKWELDNAGQSKPVTVYPQVHGNVAVAPSTKAPANTRLGNEQLLAGATWYGPGGQVIASFDDLAHINRQYGPPVSH